MPPTELDPITAPSHGLREDLLVMSRLQQRRRALGLIAGLGAGSLPLIGCGGGSNSDTTTTTATDTTAEAEALRRQRSSSSSSSSSRSSSSSSSSSSTASSSSSSSSNTSCSTIPDETAGPYPGDGTNSNSGGVVNVLTQSGVVRSDIRSSFGSFSGTAGGVPLTVRLKLVNSALSCGSLQGLAVYLWHCDAGGNYSLYNLPAQNYLRGVQVSDSSGEVTFVTIFPGCYSGRWPHMHFEIFASLASATSGNSDLKTSQLALPASVCQQVYGSDSRYPTSLNNFGRLSLASDGIFGNDSAALQMASVSGDATSGYTATLTVGVRA